MGNILDCPFCRANNLLQVEVITESKNGYIIPNKFSPGNYLIIPSKHIESPTLLPDEWWQDMKELMTSIPSLEQYNISLNLGQKAGQTVKHLHFWIIPREAGLPASGKGLASLIHATNQE